MFWRTIPHKTFKPAWLKDFPVDLVNNFAKYYNIDAVLLGAVVQVESAGNPNAVRFEPNFQHTFDIFQLANAIGCSPATMEVMQKMSWGLMQVMGSVAYEQGLGREIEPNNKWPSALLQPEVGMRYGCLHLRKKIDQYGAAPDIVYAAYNAGAPRKTKGGFFLNQGNVDKFLTFYRDLGGIY